jgi:hypothetical protein
MKKWIHWSSRGIRLGASSLFSFVVWTFWLALAVLLFVQLYIVSANELALPGFVLRHIESRLAEAGWRATFGRTSFDPAGRVLIENIRLSMPAFAEPVVTARALYVQLNPWPLMVGRIEPREMRLTDVSFAVPAMLSTSGQPEQIIRSLDATIEPTSKAITFRQFSAHVAGVPVSAHGRLMLPARTGRRPAIETLGEFVSTRFASLARYALSVAEHASRFDQPAVHFEFSPSESGAPTIAVLAVARSARLTKPYLLEIENLRASTKFLLFGDTPPSDIEISADELRLPPDSKARGVNARIVGRIRLDDSQFDLRELVVTADRISSADLEANGISAQAFPRTLPRLETNAVGHFLGSPLTVRADIDFAAKQGTIGFDGSISPRVIDLISKRVRTDVRNYFSFESLVAERGVARFGPNWKFEQLNVRVHIPRMDSYGIVMHDGHATIQLDPKRLHAPEAFARVGENFASGSYEHDFESRQYRFLLQGQLRPLEISKWFREWWTNFFQQLEFTATPPDATVDVRGTWGDNAQSNVFLFADVPGVIYRETKFDRVRTRLFIRPVFFDGLELLATRDQGDVHGRFTYIGNPETRAWRTLDLALDSTLDLKVAAEILGPAAAKTLAPFRLAKPPDLKLRGQFSGPDVQAGANDKLRIEARTSGEFRYHEFPMQDVSFIATLDRGDFHLENFRGKFAGGAATGNAQVSGTDDQRRLRFDLALTDASLGQVATGLGEFFAAKKGEAPSAPGKFVQEKANVRMNIGATADGKYGEPYSFRGAGNAMLHGAELGEVPLLGLLSELLRFTALRFTEARANFKIEGPKLEFPTVTLRGANSAIDAHGTYALDRRELDFNAKILPFQESANLLKSVVGVVLSPLSTVLEVKLTGSPQKPQWSFARGPTNLLRSLAPSNDGGAKTDADAPAKEMPPSETPNPPGSPPPKS